MREKNSSCSVCWEVFWKEIMLKKKFTLALERISPTGSPWSSLNASTASTQGALFLGSSCTAPAPCVGRNLDALQLLQVSQCYLMSFNGNISTCKNGILLWGLGSQNIFNGRKETLIGDLMRTYFRAFESFFSSKFFQKARIYNKWPIWLISRQ